MQPDTSAVQIEPCRHCGTDAPVDVHFCPRCDRILTLGRHGDYFMFFGLHRRLQVDLRDLEQRFRMLSRQFHPDYYYNASSTERLASLERASYLNDAFRTLRDPVERLEYLLKLEGFAPKEARQSFEKAPADLLEKVFELNEELEAIPEMRAGGARPEDIEARLARAREPIESSLAEHQRQVERLMAQHDTEFEAGDREGRHRTLEALQRLLIERTYLTNLIAIVRRESGGEAAAQA